MSPKLSLVTGALDRPASLQRLVDSIVRHTRHDWELVIADASKVPYKSDDPRIRVLHEVPRLGCVKGYNRAFGEAKGEYVIFLNDDAEVLEDYDTEAIQFMVEHHQIGLGALHYAEDDQPFHVNDAWGCIYANFGIIRRRLGDKIGWFDTDLKMYGNDNSLALRVLLSDHGVADIPKARVFHHSVKDTARAENQKDRMKDVHTLVQNYMPLRTYWTHAYRRYRVETGTKPWRHGIPSAQ